MTLRDPSDGLREDGSVERSKVMIGRAPGGKGPSRLWWRVTVYVGESKEEIDEAVAEALRIDRDLMEYSRGA